MSTLATQQQALLEALFAWPPQDAAQRLRSHAQGVGASPQRGLLAYQANGHMLAERALRAAYPVLAQMLGDASFADLARAFWHTCPPLLGDVAQWGQALDDFVGSSAQLQDVPYLADVARAEWALHRAATLADCDADLPTLALLTGTDPQTLVLELAPGATPLVSDWPLASLLLAHLEGQPSFAEVGELLQRRVAQDVVVWRAGLQPRLRQALPGECALLQALQSGMALEPAVGAADALDFSQWLPLAVQTGLVLGARALSTPFQKASP
ncbi:MAG: putative DNA-binding domain-containing protein [Rhodoferax sp.]|nr:putative DNA-binding domain-containing protein [Rhodoferax sp.]